MKLIFFFKLPKILCRLQKCNKDSENISSFWHNGVWTCCMNFFQLWQEYMWSEVNLSPNKPKISVLTNRDVFWPNSTWINGNLGYRCCGVDFSSLWDKWTRWLSNGVLKQELLGIQVPHFLNSIPSEIWTLWSWSFFSKCTKFCVDSNNAINISENVFGFWDNSVWTWCGNFSQLWGE